MSPLSVVKKDVGIYVDLNVHNNGFNNVSD